MMRIFIHFHVMCGTQAWYADCLALCEKLNHIRNPDPNSEAEIVVQTKEVDAEMYRMANAMFTPLALSTFFVVSGI